MINSLLVVLTIYTKLHTSSLAVLAVIAYHLNLACLPDGLLGVGLFFVLSGYLITDLLVAEWKLNGRINLKNFWLRRARRLLPALFVMLAGVVAWQALLDPSRLRSLWEDVLAAVFYVSNWWFVFHHVSYFARFGPPSPLGHLWSLAVEEQFYLIWPLLLWLGLRFVRKRGRLVELILLGALGSALVMALLYQPGTDPSRVYYGTDTRAFALLMGGALALVWPSRKLSPTLPAKGRFLLDLVGVVALVAVVYMMVATNQYETFLYRGGLVLFSAAALVLVGVLAHPAGRLGKIFGGQPWRWLGERSYGIYLWHYPVIVLTSPAVNTGGVNVGRALGQVAASVALAALSWRLVEEPIRHGYRKRKRHPSLSSKGHGEHVSVSGWITSKGAWLLLGISCLVIAGVIFFTRTDLASAIFGAHSGGRPAAAGAAGFLAQPWMPKPGQAPGLGFPGKIEPEHPKESASSGSTSPALTGQKPPAQEPAAPGGTASTPHPGDGTDGGGAASVPQAGKGVTAIGDSVMVDVAPYLKQRLPGIVVDAHIGRQLYQAGPVVAQLKARGGLGRRVIIELGTNGPFTKDQLTALLRSLGSRQIILVNTRVPRPWQGVVNQTLAQVAAGYPHTTLVDWYAASAGHSDYFYPDGVHLNPTGAEAYAALLAKAIGD
ncbi:SGNH hydrolase-type esterase domain protein [Acididesulfobacillus acetoxydans]|uniref:Acyltransferase 3 n=1 Tax=Acididesulfobacillus acetoxydans TaxID=1561005 RepID=A0A8S0Y498_9FIRM|nr:acyltransferase family protein [Acididesulfobacillus acetoxydans]CAA7602805.1 SGNH hydrolase-type esterase domain protein [Acididesulfobacillus acetoxydans]CEJ06338.1 Acyltransferase 3 [Acididesulfobacillus acetoxydans]